MPYSLAPAVLTPPPAIMGDSGTVMPKTKGVPIEDALFTTTFNPNGGFMISKTQVDSAVTLLLNNCAYALQEATFKRVESSDYDPETGEVTVVEKSFTADVISRRYKSSQVDNTNILYDDLRLLTKASWCDFKPQKNDTLVLDNHVYSIISVRSDAFESSYAIQVRG